MKLYLVYWNSLGVITTADIKYRNTYMYVLQQINIGAFEHVHVEHG